MAEEYGPVASFDASLCVLIVLAAVILTTWNENYGDTSVSAGLNIRSGLNVLASDRRVLLVGLVQSLFEASMYLFVFSWTPLLETSLGHAMKVSLLPSSKP